jgi:hypothetical protein
MTSVFSLLLYGGHSVPPCNTLNIYLCSFRKSLPIQLLETVLKVEP